jgi:hypothetical protein
VAVERIGYPTAQVECKQQAHTQMHLQMGVGNPQVRPAKGAEAFPSWHFARHCQ